MKKFGLFDVYVVYSTKWNEYRLYIYSYLTNQYVLYVNDSSVFITERQFNFEVNENDLNQIITDICLSVECSSISDLLEVINNAEK